MTQPPGGQRTTYASAGVSIEQGNRAVELMRASIARATRPEVVGGIGGFAGLFDLTPYTRLRKPLLASATDGVGTKVDVARRMDVHDTIGIDLVAMVLDDLVVCGAEPLFMTDYIATGKVYPEKIAAIVSGIAEGCRIAGAALVGGETAEHPGLLEPDEYDVAGAGTGIVDADDVLGAERVQPGDALIAMASSGLHSNGYSLARHVFFSLAGWDVDHDVDGLGRTVGEELLEPTRIYSLDCLALAHSRREQLHALSHITGGGLAENLARVIPAHLVGDHRPHDVDACAGLRVDRRAGRRRARRPREHVQPGDRHDRRRRRRGRRRQRAPAHRARRPRVGVWSGAGGVR